MGSQWDLVIPVTYFLVTLSHSASAQSNGSVPTLALGVAACVAIIFFLVLVTICAIFIYRRCTKGKPKSESVLTILGDVELAASTGKASTLQTQVYSERSNPGSSLAGGHTREDYWARQERKGHQTEDKVRRMNIADNFEELDQHGNPNAPPPPILRHVGADIKGRAEFKDNGNTHDHADRSSNTGSARASTTTEGIYNYPYPPVPIDQPSTSRDAGVVFTPVTHPSSADPDTHVASETGAQTPKPHNFQTPHQDGLFRLEAQ